jgi:thiamine kinase-like enzyme
VSAQNQKDAYHFGFFRFRAFFQRPERHVIHRIKRLNLGVGPITAQRIEGGISNRNFAVTVGGTAYFARLCEERPLLGIGRRNEVLCQRAAAGLGLAPEVIHSETGLLISRFVAGRTLTPEDLRQADYLPRVAALLRRMHDSWQALTGEFRYFCPFQTVRTYAQTALKIGACLPGDIEQLLTEAALLSWRIAPFRPVLCHNDLLAANLIDAAGRLWLVDWEYAGIGHPSFDLANLSANARFADEQDIELLAAYWGDPPPDRLTELRIFKAMSLLRESLWATIQTVASDIDFDYHRYSAENLDAYRQARIQVE